MNLGKKVLDMQLKEIKPYVVVYMITYNQEDYIEEAIMSIINQKTSFPFLIIIGEDNSTDDTGLICENLKNKYPHLIRLIRNKVNLGPSKNASQIFELCFNSGAKFIAMLEGDDYWTDNLKLQKQVNYLENNPICVISFHNCYISNYRNKIISQVYSEPLIKLSIEDLLRGSYTKTCTLVYRNILHSSSIENIIDDTTLCLELLKNGGFAMYINEVMSVYRIHEGGIWSNKNAIQKFELSLKTEKFIEKLYFRKYPKEIRNRLLLYYTQNSINLINAKHFIQGFKCLGLTFKYEIFSKSQLRLILSVNKMLIKNLIKCN